MTERSKHLVAPHQTDQVSKNVPSEVSSSTEDTPAKAITELFENDLDVGRQLTTAFYLFFLKLTMVFR